MTEARIKKAEKALQEHVHDMLMRESWPNPMYSRAQMAEDIAWYFSSRLLRLAWEPYAPDMPATPPHAVALPRFAAQLRDNTANPATQEGDDF